MKGQEMDTRATAFGRVLGALMEARGIPAEPEQMRALAERSGFDGDAFLALATSEDAPDDVGSLTGLDREMGLSEREMDVLAMAYAYEQDGIGNSSAAATPSTTPARWCSTTGRGSTRRTGSASSTSWAPNGTRRGRRRSGSRRRSGWRWMGSRWPVIRTLTGRGPSGSGPFVACRWRVGCRVRVGSLGLQLSDRSERSASRLPGPNLRGLAACAVVIGSSGYFPQQHAVRRVSWASTIRPGSALGTTARSPCASPPWRPPPDAVRWCGASRGGPGP